MSFRHGLLRARGQIAFLIGLSLALGLVFWLERIDFVAEQGAPVTLAYGHPEPPPPRPLDPAEREIARAAMVQVLDAPAVSPRLQAETILAILAAARLGIMDPPAAIAAIAAVAEPATASERAGRVAPGPAVDGVVAARLVLAGAGVRRHLPAAATPLQPLLGALPLAELASDGRLRRDGASPGQLAHAARALALAGVGAWQDWHYRPLATALQAGRTGLAEAWQEGLVLTGLAFGLDGIERELLWRLRHDSAAAEAAPALAAAGFFPDAAGLEPDSPIAAALLVQALAHRALGPLLAPAATGAPEMARVGDPHSGMEEE